MKNNREKLEVTDFLVGIAGPLLIFTSTQKQFLLQNIVYGIYIAVIILAISRSRRLTIPRTARPLFIGIITCVMVLPIISFHVDSINAVAYIALVIVFLFYCNIFGYRLSIRFRGIILIWLCISMIIIGFQVITHLDEINGRTLMSVFYSPTDLVRYRASFGFTHPNFTAIVINSALLLCYIALKTVRRKSSKRWILTLIILNIVFLLCTGSRTGVISAMAFIALELYFTVIKRARIQKVIGVANVFIILIISLIAFQISLDWNILSDFSSGRINAVFRGLQVLNSQGVIWLGFQVSNISNATATLATIGLQGIDSWYFMQIARFGIIGLVITVVPFMMIAFKMYKQVRSFKIESYRLSALIVLMLYGMAENIVFNQAMVLSLLVWGLVFQQMYYFKGHSANQYRI